MKSPKSKTLSPESARGIGQVLVSLTALAVVTCAGATRPPTLGAAPVSGARPAAPPAPSGAPPPLLATGSAEVAGAAPTLAPPPGARLARFRAALQELASGKRKESVRVLWLGDSHTAADFWPDAIRKPLQDRFGAGGPGFIYAGLNWYRHSNVKLEREGQWRTEPRQPSLWMRQNDGVFGLGGIRVVPLDEKSRTTITLSPEAVRGGAHWDLAFRLPDARARFRVRVDGGDAKWADAKTFPVGAVAHLTWESKPGATVAIDSATSAPELLGIIAEAATPGLVLDTLGINGARIGTPLAWEEAPWLAEASRRHAALVVVAYGTNEVGDQVAPFRYGAELEALVARARKAAPDADCLVVGPTDRAAPDWTTLPRVSDIDAVEEQTAERVGCAFFSSFQSMGGEGSLKHWAGLTPPLAGSDHVHLTPKGYAELGGSMLKEVVGEAPSTQPRAEN